MAVAIALLSTQYPSTATVLSPSDAMATGRTQYEAGALIDAIDSWQTAVQAAAQQGDLAQQVMGLNSLSSAYQDLNDWPRANDAVEQSHALLEKAPHAEPILWAQTLNTQAALLLSHGGEAEAALATWQDAAHYYEAAGDTLGLLGSQINQAEALKSLGFYRRAKEQLGRVNQQLATLPDSTVKIAGLRSLGKALQLIGHPQDSYAVLAEGLAIAQHINAIADLSSLHRSIGELAAKQGSYDTAIAYLQSAEDMALTPGDQLQARLVRLAIYVDAITTGAPNRQPPIADLAQSIEQQLSTLPPSRATIYGTVNLAHHLTRLPTQQRPLSNQHLSELLAQATIAAHTLHDQRAEAYALQQRGELYAQTQQWSDAVRLTQQSLDLAEAIHSSDVISQSAWLLGKLYKQQRQLQPAIDFYTEAITALKDLRGDLASINQDVQFSYREQVEPVYRELVALLIEENNQESLEQARTVLEALQVAELDNFFREACLDLQANQIDQIDPNATVVYAIMLPDRLATIYSSADQPLKVYETSVSQSQLESTLQSFLSTLHPAGDRAKLLRYSQQLYDWLIRPAEETGELTPDQTVVFVLDGLLRSIPMATLHDGQQYLIEKYAVALSPGLQLMPANALGERTIQAFLGGISKARGSFSDLPEVKSEVEDISQWVSASQLLDEAFTRDALTNHLANKKVDVVHLATHGRFSSNFDDTFLLTWDDTININELAEILQAREANKQTAIELLTLSACETAAGDERAVLGLAGLAVRSGARSTIATLWPIKDQVAKQLMTTFYRTLSQEHLSKAEALRQAQLELLHSNTFTDPFFWSSYVLIGNWL